MGDLSDHFSRREFACHCGCGFDAVSPELIEVLEQARRYFASPIVINSGCRCAQHNHAVGGTPGSQHQLGTAADIVVTHTSAAIVADYFEQTYPTQYGIGRYKTFTHIDVRKTSARWS